MRAGLCPQFVTTEEERRGEEEDTFMKGPLKSLISCISGSEAEQSGFNPPSMSASCKAKHTASLLERSKFRQPVAREGGEET